MYVVCEFCHCCLSIIAEYYASVRSSKHMFIRIEVVMKLVKLDKQQCITYIVKCN